MKISEILVCMAIYKRPTVPGVVPKHAWGVRSLESVLEAGWELTVIR